MEAEEGRPFVCSYSSGEAASRILCNGRSYERREIIENIYSHGTRPNHILLARGNGS